jgi:hypothetical protein
MTFQSAALRGCIMKRQSAAPFWFAATASKKEEPTMMNKILLAAIALGLWANAAATFVKPARADSEYGQQIYSILTMIEYRLRSGTIDVNCVSGCKK